MDEKKVEEEGKAARPDCRRRRFPGSRQEENVGRGSGSWRKRVNGRAQIGDQPLAPVSVAHRLGVHGGKVREPTRTVGASSQEVLALCWDEALRSKALPALMKVSAYIRCAGFPMLHLLNQDDGMHPPKVVPVQAPTAQWRAPSSPRGGLRCLPSRAESGGPLRSLKSDAAGDAVILAAAPSPCIHVEVCGRHRLEDSRHE